MALNTDSIGKRTDALTHTYEWRDVVLYALGVGATLDEIDYLYEARGPKVLPTYAVIPTFPVCAKLFEVIGGDLRGVVHGAQKITLHQPFAPSGELTTVGEVSAIYDLKRFAEAVLTTQTHDHKGALLCETEWSILFRFDGGFDGERPPARPRTAPPSREADFEFVEQTTREQAALYRLSGDLNPLHIDDAVATAVGFDRPILHGLCTFGYVGRALLRGAGGDTPIAPARVRELRGQFRRPVWPGESLVIRGWRGEEPGAWTLSTSTTERPEEVAFGNASALLSE